MDAVDAAMIEKTSNEQVVADILYNLEPMYLPRLGAYIPFARVGSRLIEGGTSSSR